MDLTDDELLQFESLSPSGRYNELAQYCVHHLSLWLDQMLEGEGIREDDISTPILLDRLTRNQRTLRSSYQFQLQKLFSDFKAIRPARLYAHQAAPQNAGGLFDTHGNHIRPAIERIERQILQHLRPRLLQLDLRMKYLVHRSDDGLDDNPLRPGNLCNAFVSALETLKLPRERLLDLLEIYGRQIGHRLPAFCQQCDRALSEQGVRFDLPFVEDDELATEASGAETATEANQASSEGPLPEDALRAADGDSGQAPPPPATDEAPKDDPHPAATPEPDDQQPFPAAADDAGAQAKETPEAERTPFDEASAPVVRRSPGHVPPPARSIIDRLKEQNEAPEALIGSFLDCIDRLMPVVSNKQRDDLQKFAHYYTGLIDNPHVSEPLRQQLLRLAAPLLYLVMSDPFFFRSSAHPVNDFLHSMIDFEIRHGHKPQNLKVLTLLIDNLLRLEVPVFSDFQPITQGYEVFKRLELERILSEKKTRELNQERLKNHLLEWTEKLTGSIDIDRDSLAFFYDDWLLYLLQVARQYGEDSNELQDAKELARMLAWSLNPERPENPHYASQRFTVLLREIDRALRSMDYPAQHRQRLRRVLVRQFRQANRPASIYAVQPLKPAAPALQPALLQGAERPPGRTPPEKRVQPELYPDIASLIHIGDWIEIKPQPGSGWRSPQRGKLRWQSTDGIYRFFNQHGSIILEISADELNRLFARGEASLLKPFSNTGLGNQLGSGFRSYR